MTLSGPILHDTAYYRCDTPYRAILFQGGQHFPKMVQYPPLVLSFTKAHLCDTPFYNISRENCAIPPQKQAQKSFAILSLQVSRDMKGIATGPLRREASLRHGPRNQEAAQHPPKGFSRKYPLHFVHFNGAICSNTLCSNTSVLTKYLSFRAVPTCKGSRTPPLVEHFWVPILGASCSEKPFGRTQP